MASLTSSQFIGDPFFSDPKIIYYMNVFESVLITMYIYTTYINYV